MILFFGTRPGKRTVQVLKRVSCPHCHQKGTLQLIAQPNYFHLFWLPLFTIGTSRFAECSFCKRVYYQEEFTREMRQEMGL